MGKCHDNNSKVGVDSLPGTGGGVREAGERGAAATPPFEEERLGGTRCGGDTQHTSSPTATPGNGAVPRCPRGRSIGRGLCGAACVRPSGPTTEKIVN